MKPTRSVFRPLLLVAGLLSWGLPVQSAPPRADAAPVRAVPAAAEPVQQLIIRYRVREAQSDRAAAASATDERAAAAERVSRSAERAQAWGMHYLKSVSPQLHVARLSRALPADEAQALIERLKADPAVASVTIDQRVRPHALPLPTDPYFTSASSGYYQWHLQAPSVVAGGINAAAAWASSTGANVTVAVLDGGYTVAVLDGEYRPHPDLVANLLTASDYDFISDLLTANDGNLRDTDAQDPGDWVSATDPARPADCPVEDSTWHGTHVTGLLGAMANNTDGVGVAPGVKVLPVRVLGRCGGYLSDILAGMRWAAGLSVSGVTNTSTPARALNLSLGVEGACDAATQDVINEVRARGVSIVASTGNDGLTVITKPASCMGVVAVTAHDRLGVLASYANVGSGTAISAPGGERDGAVASTWNLGKTVPGADSYGLMYGTSMAAPQVAGTLALMSAARADLAQPTLEALIRDTARAFPAGTYCVTNPDRLPPGFCGVGLLDAGRALAAAQAVGVGLPDVEVLQRVTASSWVTGATVTLNIHLRNWGASTASAVQLTATLKGLEILSVSGLSATSDVTSLRAAVGDLNAGAERVLTVTARVTAADPDTISSLAVANGASEEPTLSNNTHRLDPMGAIVAPAAEVETSDGGGGCTVAPEGQADAGLPLLALVAAIALFWRRRRAMP